VPAPVPDQEVGGERGHENEAEQAPELGDPGGDEDDGVAEAVSQRQPRARPEEHAREVIESETHSRDPEDAGERRHERGQSGEELRGEHASCAVAAEDALRAAHARVRFGGHPAESRQQPRSATAAELVPGEVGTQRRHGHRPEHEREADAAVRGQGADREQSRHGGERDAELLGDGKGRQDEHAVVLEKLQAISGAHCLLQMDHARSSLRCRIPASGFAPL